jgi:hypothetical protein
MTYDEKTRFVVFSAIAALAGLLIVVINAHALFPQLLFYSVVIVLIGVIVVLVVYAFFWQPTKRYAESKRWNRKMNKLARRHFGDLRDFSEKFTSLPEFQGQSQGVIRILEDLVKKANTVQGNLIQTRTQEFDHILRNPLNDFKGRLRNLQWRKKSINYAFLSSIVKELENYVALHKRLYVDFVVKMAREIGLEKLSNITKRLYSEYREDYNQFVVAYTELAEGTWKAELGIFDKNLKKANAL